MKSFIKNPLFLFLLFVLMSSFLPKDFFRTSHRFNASNLNFDTSACTLNPTRDGIRIGDDNAIPSGYPDPAKVYIDAYTAKDLYVNYRFGMDETAQHRNILILQGGYHNPADYSKIMGQKLKYRTGSSDDSFCPMKCNW